MRTSRTSYPSSASSRVKRPLAACRLGRFGRFVAAGIGVLAAGAASAQGGPGDLLVAPTRIVLEGRQRTAEVTLVNTGSARATYRISFVNLRMNELGGTSEIEASGARPGEQFADQLVRYSPRQVTLEPQVAQTVRMQLRLPADLPPGEYRSHLLFRAIPPVEAAKGPAEGDSEFSVQLTAIYGISIPVIVRHGETSATATLSDLELVASDPAESAPTLRFRIHRTGDRSLYGNLTATYYPPGGQPVVVGMANGVAIYTPNPTRSAGIQLHVPPGIALRKGRIHLAFTRQEKGNETIAEADLPVP